MVISLPARRANVNNRTEQADTWDSITKNRPEGVPTLYTPRKINERIKAQSSCFLLTKLETSIGDSSIFSNETRQSSVQPILIRSELKPQIREYLQYSRGIRDYDLFPDFDGYAQANSATSSFKRSAKELFSME